MNILIAEDDRDIAELIALYLRKSGWSTHVVSTGTEALLYVRQHPVDTVILDIMMPGLSGLEVCRALRADRATAAIPIIMVTARAEETDRIIGLDLGADDYIAKPFNPNELVARVRALARRSKLQESQESVLRLGALLMDLTSHAVTYEGQQVKLTAKEFLLLRYLLEHRGR